MSEYAKTLQINFSDPFSPKHLCKELYEEKQRGWSEFYLEACDSEAAYSNTCAPIAGIIDHYRRLDCDISCSWDGVGNTYISHTRIDNPFQVGTDEGRKRIIHPFDVVWKFNDSSDIEALVEASRKEVCEQVDVEEGVLSGIEWCLNEIMDNVLQHSNASYGYFMGQYHPKSKRLSLCVYDNGRGILNSLSKSKHAPKDPLDALTIALQERVTRDESIGQGNGLWGFSRIVNSNKGSYLVSSHGARIYFKDGKAEQLKKGGFFYGSEKLGTTLVDFQLECNNSINVADALNHNPTRLWLENLESPSGENYVIKISEMSEGTGTRRAAERIRHIVTNTLREGRKSVILDFAGVSVVSSSYADELIGKLVINIGFSAFNHHCLLRNVSPLNQQVIDRSVQQRMAQHYYDAPPIPDGD